MTRETGEGTNALMNMDDMQLNSYRNEVTRLTAQRDQARDAIARIRGYAQMLAESSNFALAAHGRALLELLDGDPR